LEQGANGSGDNLINSQTALNLNLRQTALSALERDTGLIGPTRTRIPAPQNIYALMAH